MNELRPYQWEAVAFLSQRKHALLADEPGVGKTAPAIVACDGVGASRILVLAPAIGTYMWRRRFAEWSVYSHECRIMASGKDKPLAQGVTICSYDLSIKKPLSGCLLASPWDVVILDESHYVKGRSAKRSRLAWTCLTSLSDRVWALTGTPCPNNLAELYPMLESFGAYDGKYWDFVQEFCTGFDNGYSFSISGNNKTALPKFRQMLKPFLLRRTKTEVLPQMPPLTFDTLEVQAKEVDAILYFPERFIRPSLTTLEEIVAKERDALIAQLESGTLPPDTPTWEGRPFATLRKYVGLQKMGGYLEHITEELRSGAIDKIVIFGIHRDVLKTLDTALKKEFGSLLLYGGTNQKSRDTSVNLFQTSAKHRVMVAQIHAASTVIDLFAACHVDILEPAWSPAWNAQAIMRVHRSGQERPVVARFIVINDPVDQNIHDILRRKTKSLAEAGLAVF